VDDDNNTYLKVLEIDDFDEGENGDTNLETKADSGINPNPGLLINSSTSPKSS